MPTSHAQLTLLALPQRWDGSSLTLRILLLPKGDPRVPLFPGSPAFADVDQDLAIAFQPGLERMPDPTGIAGVPVTLVQPTSRLALFDELAMQVTPGPDRTDPPLQINIRKAMPSTYRSLRGLPEPHNSYECALTDPEIPSSPPLPPASNPSWGQTLAFALRQPQLARGLGLLFESSFLPSDPAALDEGGWLWVTLGSAGPFIANANETALYAARIPALRRGVARPLFAPVLFPVQPIQPAFPEEIFREASAYNDGFAKIVHATQASNAPTPKIPVDQADGLRLGWDDEQIVTWLNRQVAADPANPQEAMVDVPCVVQGYRVDVRRSGSSAWNSLMQVHSTSALTLGPVALGTFDGELSVEAVPVRVKAGFDGDYWLPPYFTTWSGESLALNDHSRSKLEGVSVTGPYVAAGIDRVPLRFGEEYEFRVRMMDLAGGGPESGDAPENPAQHPIARARFRRAIAPGALKVTSDAVAGSVQYKVTRPYLAYPDALFTGFPNALNELMADLNAQPAHDPANGVLRRQARIPDPDVRELEIIAEARGPNDAYVSLFTATRPFPSAVAQDLVLDVKFTDTAQITVMSVPASGPLVLPSAREIRLTLTPICKPDPALAYFAKQETRRGIAHQLHVRSEANDERSFLVAEDPGMQFKAFFFQSRPAEDLVQDIARHLGLPANGLALLGGMDRRVVFGASSALNCGLAPDGSHCSLFHASGLMQHWLIAIRVRVNRDWTWDGLDGRGVEFLDSEGDRVGCIKLPRSTTNSNVVDHSFTELIFFDIVDPKPAPGDPPTELPIDYRIKAAFRNTSSLADPPFDLALTLPVTSAPHQIPKLVGAGLAQSEFRAAQDYSSTEPLHKMLWLEFDETLDDPKDVYFARVLANAADPLMIPRPPDNADIHEPELPVGQELVRVITADESRDQAGLAAMQRLIPSGHPQYPRHYLLPLPPGLGADSPELFGFFTYEFRVGHDETRWCTAQARFGPPLRLTGLQHPAPDLKCIVQRGPRGILVTTAAAQPVSAGRSLRPPVSKTKIWALLYARVTQADESGWRNILLAQAVGKERFTPSTDQIYADVPLVPIDCAFDIAQVNQLLFGLALPANCPLTVMAAELLPEPTGHFTAPLGKDLGKVRLLRASSLMSVPGIC